MTKDEKFLKTARDRWKLADEADSKQRKRELEDIRFYNGEQWDEDLQRSRGKQTLSSGVEVPARPCLVINKTKEPIRQVLNQERQSDLGIELIPADDWGEATGPIDHTEIELREGLVRRIQRDSEAADARTWAFSRAAISGRGYWLVMTRYVPGKSQDQEVYIDRIYNQMSVRVDPSHEQPDGSDIEWGFYGRDMLWSEFKAEYPDSKLSKDKTLDENDTQWRSLEDKAPGWFTLEGEKRGIRVMNYYYTERESVEVYHLSNGGAAYDDELVEVAPDQPRVLDSDPSVYVLTDDDGGEQCHNEVKKTIQWAKITGNEILDETEWPGHWIPIIKTVGEELHLTDSERKYEGLVRPMRDSCKANNYLASKFVERVGLTPIPPYLMAGGQEEGYGDEWDASNTRTLSRLHYNQKDEFGQAAPPPFRADARAEVSDLASGLQIFGQAIQATSVMPETALGHTDPTVKSGRLAQALIEQGNQGTSNFMDNLVRSLRHEARVVNDLLYPIYGRQGRLARMMNGQGEKAAVLIGQPFQVQGQGKEARPVPVNLGPSWQPGMPLPEGVKYHGLTPDANFNVAAKMTKTVETRRQQISQFLGELIGSSPEQMSIIGDKLWKYLDVPDHEEIEERYKAVLAPPIQALLQGNEPIPPQAQAQIAQLTQQLQEVMPLADKNRADIEKTKIQEAAETERMAMRQMSEDSRSRADNETKIAVAELGAKVERLALFLEERQRIGLQMQEGTESELMRQHEREMADQEAQQQAQLAEQQHQQQLEQGAQGHAQTLDQQEQAAALQPAPEAE